MIDFQVKNWNAIDNRVDGTVFLVKRLSLPDVLHKDHGSTQ